MPSIARSFGGPTEAVLGYLEAGFTVGIQGEVLAPTPGVADLTWLRERASGAQVHSIPSGLAGRLTVAPRLLAWLGARATEYDIVHVHGLLDPVSSLAARTMRTRSRPYVVRPFGTLSRYTFSHRRVALKRAWLRLLDAPNLRRAAAVHFTTEEERDEAGWHGIEFRAECVVPPPARLTRMPRRTARPGRRVLFLSRLHPKKGLEALLDAWPLVLERIPTAELVIAGDGEATYVNTLRMRAARVAASAPIVLSGFATGEAKLRAFTDADVFVLPSFQENFGVVVIEALAAGLPVVLTAEVQLASFVQRHELGVVSTREPEILARDISRVLDDDILRARVGDRGPEIVEANFSPVSIGGRLLAMYEGATGRA